MTYIHKLESVLSSIFVVRNSFSLSLPSLPNIMGSQARRSMARNSHFTHAFTLIELLVVIAIIAILISIAYPVYTGILERGKATKDMSNLRQIGTATQAFMNDNDGALFAPSTPSFTPPTWMFQLNPKYLPTWATLQSPFDKRSPSEAGDGGTPISYGVNTNIYSGTTALSATSIRKPTAFILFAPAQAAETVVSFLGWANSPAAGVTVKGIGSNKATSVPGGDAIGGTQNNRQRINALFADLHCETMSWATFTNKDPTAADPDGAFRWSP
jgi:prepilin-type N-terminal cleavage/methylation domain-containing protein